MIGQQPAASAEPHDALSADGNDAKASVGVQTILFRTPAASLERTVEALARTAELAVMETGVVSRVAMRAGDCSPARCLEDEDVRRIVERFGWIVDFRYTWFGENLGSAGGHNRLAEHADEDMLLILNPDVVVSPRLLELLLGPFRQASVGMTEAKQLPIEHPKDYDVATGDTSWAATACAMVTRQLFEKVGGFDDTSFFLYGDDVDFSWRVRLEGLRVVHQPAAVVLHDKRVDHDGVWISGDVERYYSAEAALMLATKWSRPDLVEDILASFDAYGAEPQKRAAEAYRGRLAAGDLPAALDPDHRVGMFIDGFYAPHRFGPEA